MKEIKELRSKVAKLVSKLQEEAEHRQVSTGEWESSVRASDTWDNVKLYPPLSKNIKTSFSWFSCDIVKG